MPKTKKKTSKRKPNPAFMRPVQPDDKLAAIVGSQPLPRSELTKKLWNYIKKHGCQDKKKRTMINADDSLITRKLSKKLRLVTNFCCSILPARIGAAGAKSLTEKFSCSQSLRTTHGRIWSSWNWTSRVPNRRPPN